MITRPLDLDSHLSRPPRDLDTVHWVSVACAALFFLLAGSRFVLAPGLLVADAPDFKLMEVGPSGQNVRTAGEVVTYRRDNIILFQGAVYKRLIDLKKPLEQYAMKHRGEVLPVLADQQVSAQSVSQLVELAKVAGFGGVLLLGQTGETAGQSPTK